MACPKVYVHRLINKIDHPPRKRVKGITIQEPSKDLPTTQRLAKHVSDKEKFKGKGKQKVVEQPTSDDSDSGNISWSDDDAPKQNKDASTTVHTLIVETQPPPLAQAHASKRTRIEMCSKVIHDPLTARVPRVIPVIAPKSMKRLKSVVQHTIFEEKRLSMDGVVDRYPEIWRTIQFHTFEQFTRGRIPHVQTWVREFYKAYARQLPKKQKGVSLEPLNSVEVWGKTV